MLHVLATDHVSIADLAAYIFLLVNQIILTVQNVHRKRQIEHVSEKVTPVNGLDERVRRFHSDYASDRGQINRQLRYFAKNIDSELQEIRADVADIATAFGGHLSDGHDPIGKLSSPERFLRPRVEDQGTEDDE